MAPRRFFIAAATALAVLAGYNALIWRLAKETQRERLLTALGRIPLSTRLVFLGNSLVQAGCNPHAFAAGWSQGDRPLACVNLALGATSPVEHYLILRRAFQRPLHPRYLVYGFFDDQLTAPARGTWSDLVGNRAFSYYFPSQAAAFYDPGSRLAAWRLALIAHIPMLAERSSLWDKVELFRRRLEDIGVPKPKTNRYGRVADFKALEPADVASFEQRCQSIVRKHEGFAPPVQAIIRLARQHGVRVFLVEMPMSPEHRRNFYSLKAWKALRTYFESLARNEDVTYVAASDWVADGSDFADTIHLNERGARLFSERLAATLHQLAFAGTNQSPSSILAESTLGTARGKGGAMAGKVARAGIAGSAGGSAGGH